MNGNDELKIRITADPDDAVKGLRDVSSAEGKLSDEVKASGRVTDTASEKTRERAKGNKQLTGSLKDAERAEGRAARGADQYGRSASSAAGNTGVLGKALQSARGALTGMIGGFVGVAGITAAMRAYERQIEAVNTRLKENAQLTRDAADAALELQFLNLVPDPTERAFAEEQAVLAGRNPTEGVRALGSLRSKNPNADPQQLKQLLTLAALKAQQTNAPIEDIAGGLSLINKFTNDPIASSNILEQAITEAGELDIKNIIPLFGKFVPTGVNIGGLTAGQSTGFVSGVTSLGLPREEATTSLKNLVLAIKGKGTPEGSKILQRENINRQDFPTALRQITAAFSEGRIKPQELQLIGGDSALAVLSSLSDPKILNDLLASVGRVADAERSGSLIVSDKASAQFGADEIQSLNLNLKQQESRLKKLRQNDKRAIRIATARAIIEQKLERAVSAGDITPLDSETKLRIFDRSVAQGKSLSEAATFAEVVGSPFGAPVNDDIRLGTPFFERRIGPELSDVVQNSLQAGPDITGKGIGVSGQPVIQNIQNINNGTIVNHARDSDRDDLASGSPPN